MALNDIFRFINQGGQKRIEIRNDPQAVDPVLTIREGAITLGGPPADPGTVETGSLYQDQGGDIHYKGQLVQD